MNIYAIVLMLSRYKGVSDVMILIFIFRYLNQHEKKEENQIHEKIVKRKVGSWDP